MSGRDDEKTRLPLDIRVPTAEEPRDLEDDGPDTEEIPPDVARTLVQRAPAEEGAPGTGDAAAGPELLPDLDEEPPTQQMDAREIPLPSRYRLLEVGRIEGPVETLDVLDTELDRMVVLCRWRGEPRAFRKWSRARAQLEVAGIPPVYDVGTLPDGARYLTVQAVHGRTVEEAQLADSGFVRVWSEACRVVAWAHGRGIVHGDLVPLRMRVDARGRVQIGGWLGSASRPSVDLESLRRLFRARFPGAPTLEASSATGLAEAGEAWFRRRSG